LSNEYELDKTLFAEDKDINTDNIFNCKSSMISLTLVLKCDIIVRWLGQVGEREKNRKEDKLNLINLLLLLKLEVETLNVGN